MIKKKENTRIFILVIFALVLSSLSVFNRTNISIFFHNTYESLMSRNPGFSSSRNLVDKGGNIDELSIIDRFIEADPKISPMENNEPIESVINGDFNSEELMTESLAKLLLRQKKYKKAIKAYKILSLKYPEKNVFFARQIKKIKKLLQ